MLYLARLVLMQYDNRSKSTKQMNNEESDSEMTNPSDLTSTPNIPPPLRRVTRSQRAELDNTHRGSREEDSTDNDIRRLTRSQRAELDTAHRGRREEDRTDNDVPPSAVDGHQKSKIVHV